MLKTPQVKACGVLLYKKAVIRVDDRFAV